MVSELGGWYTRSVPEMGFYVQERRFGFYQLQKDTGRVRATVRHLRGQGRFLLARVAGEPASVVGFYEGEDRFIHHLATRVPFRRRGIASRLISEVLAGARESGCRSTIISAAERGHPVGLYRSLGFTDEVYWRREYKHVPCTGGAVARGHPLTRKAPEWDEGTSEARTPSESDV